MAQFRKIFWGLLLINLTVTCCGHAMSRGPGYVVLALGAGGLASVSPRFRRASRLCWVALAWLLLSVWLFDLLRIGDPMTGVDALLYPAVHALIDCLLVWALFGGIGDYARHYGCPALAVRALRVRAAYVVVAGGTLLAQIACPEPNGQLAVPIIIGVIAWIVWLVAALGLIHRMRRVIAVHNEMTQEDAAWPWQFSLRTLLLLPVALWLLLLACFPKLATGDFCNVKIKEASVRDDGQVEIAYATRTSSDTTRVEKLLPSGGGGSARASMGPVAWPMDGSSTLCFSLNPDRIPLRAQEIRDRLLVEEGKTYRVVPGKPLYFYDFKSKDGTRQCGYLEVTAGSRLGL